MHCYYFKLKNIHPASDTLSWQQYCHTHIEKQRGEEDKGDKVTSPLPAFGYLLAARPQGCSMFYPVFQ